MLIGSTFDKIWFAHTYHDLQAIDHRGTTDSGPIIEILVEETAGVGIAASH